VRTCSPMGPTRLEGQTTPTDMQITDLYPGHGSCDAMYDMQPPTLDFATALSSVTATVLFYSCQATGAGRTSCPLTIRSSAEQLLGNCCRTNQTALFPTSLSGTRHAHHHPEQRPSASLLVASSSSRKIATAALRTPPCCNICRRSAVQRPIGQRQ
jgi:hypothetical protein